MKRAKSKQRSHAQNRQAKPENPKLPFIEHLYELRRRLFYVALSVGLWATGAYFVQQHIVDALLRPAQNQQFIYTSVGGGIDFLFRVCLYTGVVCSIPVIVYQILKYLEPLIKKHAVQFILRGSIVSGVLAIAGMAFGYFVGLPAALHFLLHQFTSDQIHPLLTIQSYMSFVTLYMLGSALLFQLPLLIVLINRIKPLQPKKLLSMERWVILVAFILGGIINPSPRVQDQVLLAGPIILTYQVGVLIVWWSGHGKRRPHRVQRLLAQDAKARAERLARFYEAQAALAAKRTAAIVPALSPLPQPADVPIPADDVPSVPVETAQSAPMVIPGAPAVQTKVTHAVDAPTPLSAPVHRPLMRRNYANDFLPRGRGFSRPLSPTTEDTAT